MTRVGSEWIHSSHSGRRSEGASSESGGVSAPTRNMRGRDCGMKCLASIDRASMEYPSELKARIAAVRSSPECEEASPVTFSRTATGGRLSPISSRIRMKCQNVPDCLPPRPSRLPARDRSVQGEEAQATALSIGKSLPWTSAMSPM